MQETILIIEDDPVYLDLCKRAFAQTSYKIITANNGLKGLELARKMNPHLILLDIKMDQMDGFGMMKHLREDLWGKTVPVIMMTNLDPEDALVGELLVEQPTHYFMKSRTDLKDVVKKVDSILQQPST